MEHLLGQAGGERHDDAHEQQSDEKRRRVERAVRLHAVAQPASEQGEAANEKQVGEHTTDKRLLDDFGRVALEGDNDDDELG